MLVLTRKPGKRIVIDDGTDQIVITFIATRRDGQARIGIDAPMECKILREEAKERLEKNGG